MRLSDGEPVIKFISKKASDGSDPDKCNEFKIVAEEPPLTWQRQM
jgi:hypothetical protein